MESGSFNKVKFNKVREIIRSVVCRGVKVEVAYEMLTQLGYSPETALLVLAAGTACQ